MNHLSTTFDYLIINPGFNDFSAISDALKRNLKVAISIENDLHGEEDFYSTRLFPSSFFEIKGKVQLFEQWKHLMAFAPHLFRAQKVFYSGNANSNKFKTAVTDYFNNNTFQKKAQRIDEHSKLILPQLKNEWNGGVYFQEYTFAISRFYIEVLKYFEKEGATIFIDPKEKLNAKEVVEGLFQKKTVYKSSYEIPAGFSMVIPSGDFRFAERNGVLQIEPMKENERLYSEEEIKNLVSEYFQVDKEKITTETKKLLSFSAKAVFQWLQNVNSKLPCSFENAAFEDMFELCLEKFDLAKQCQISFPEFQILFHRYGNGIDEMIEMAYEKMNGRENFESLWKDVENDYQRKFEWKI